MVKSSLLLLGLAALVVAAPPQALEPRAPQSCSGQSCALADLSGSTGRPFPKTKPSGGTASGDKCIGSYPGTGYYKGGSTSDKRSSDDESSLDISVVPRAACKENIFIFARGTTEVGTMGESVGPAMKSKLTAAMPGKWNFQGVSYSASMAGDECIGLPGGASMSKEIDAAAANCPSQKIWASGYSEGAMVAHNGVANAKAASKKKIAVSDIIFKFHVIWGRYTNTVSGCCRLWRPIQWRPNQRLP
jgi:Cutinase